MTIDPSLIDAAAAATVCTCVAGKYRQGDEYSIPRPPTAVCTDFVSAVEHILSWQ